MIVVHLCRFWLGMRYWHSPLCIYEVLEDDIKGKENPLGLLVPLLSSTSGSSRVFMYFSYVTLKLSAPFSPVRPALFNTIHALINKPRWLLYARVDYRLTLHGSMAQDVKLY